MRVLAIDTALEACSCAILDTARREAMIASRSETMVRGHAEALVPLVSDMMKDAGVSFTSIDRFAVTTGPGSFTGLRVGISAARGFALAAEKPVVGLSTLAALAAPHIAEDDTVPVIVALDARHNHVYLQAFAAGGRTVIAPRIAPLEDAIRAANGAPARIVGSAAAAVAAGCKTGPILVDERRAPDIAWVARLGAAADEKTAAPKPLYLRAADAQPQSASQLPRR
jgi:tRNA threonylcarbamoyl adenosine modification protein YeaZ